MQIYIWYPAEETANAAKMVYGEYAFAYPEDDSFINVLSALQSREIRYLNGAFANNQGLILDMMSLEMAAVRDAPLDLPGPRVYNDHPTAEYPLAAPVTPAKEYILCPAGID